MRIAFLCSSLEPGRDGVGDYTTLLARECTRQGHPTALIALNDRHSTQTTEGVLTASESAHAGDIPYLRLPSHEDWATRTAKAIAFLREFAPDWISLQFVCYGFQEKGIVAQQIRYLITLVRDVQPAQTHIMLHELWIGGTRDSSHKDNLIGTIQRHFILKLIKGWNPSIVHTSNEYYRQRLVKSGLSRTKILSLFGNIPVSTQIGIKWCSQILNDADSSFTIKPRSQILIGGFFGTLHPEWSPEPTISYLKAAAKEMGRDLLLLSAGRIGTKGKGIWEAMKTNYGGEITIIDLGELQPCGISEYLSNIDFAIAASPARLIGKSGTVAAMVDHGLPIIISRIEGDALVPWDDRSRMLIRIADSSLPDWLVHSMVRLPAFSSLPKVAREFIISLSKEQY